jgi:hypothetical protein
MIFSLIGLTAASEVCKNSMSEMGIGYDECMAIQDEFVSFVDSGMTVDDLSTELAQCDQKMTCDDCYKTGCEESCMAIKDNGACNIPVAGCARQVAYGGYVKSHVLIQCYGMIDEGCKRLPTIYGATQVKTAAPAGAAGGDGSGDRMPSCKEMCEATCKAQDPCCKPSAGVPALGGVNTCCGNDCKDWGTVCMKSNFKNYLRCVGRRVSKCYRQKWVVSKECINAEPTEWGGCTKEWNQKYECVDNCKNGGNNGGDKPSPSGGACDGNYAPCSDMGGNMGGNMNGSDMGGNMNGYLLA